MLCFSVDVRKDVETDCYELAFPAFNGAVTCTNDKAPDDVLRAAVSWLSLNVGTAILDSDPIPEDGYDMYPITEGFERRIYVSIPGEPNVKKTMTKMTLTLPTGLQTAGRDVGLNFSELLRDAIFEKVYGIRPSQSHDVP